MFIETYTENTMKAEGKEPCLLNLSRVRNFTRAHGDRTCAILDNVGNEFLILCEPLELIADKIAAALKFSS